MTRPNRAQRLLSIFGMGIADFAREVQVSHMTARRWLADRETLVGQRHGRAGEIGPEYNHRIRAAAVRLGLPMNAVNSCLASDTCPCCGQGVRPGVVVEIPTCHGSV